MTAGNIERRIKSLEAVCNGEPCEECGWAGDWKNVEIEVIWHDADPDAAPGDWGPKSCGTCGHQLEYVIKWADLPDPLGAA